jgi:hypothetical protein
MEGVRSSGRGRGPGERKGGRRAGERGGQCRGQKEEAGEKEEEETVPLPCFSCSHPWFIIYGFPYDSITYLCFKALSSAQPNGEDMCSWQGW